MENRGRISNIQQGISNVQVEQPGRQETGVRSQNGAGKRGRGRKNFYTGLSKMFCCSAVRFGRGELNTSRGARVLHRNRFCTRVSKMSMQGVQNV